MSFMNKLKEKLRRFMIGRRGADELSFALLIGGVVMMLLTALTGFMLFDLIGWIFYVWCLFRMFSRNLTKRYEENMKYLALKQSAAQAWTRLKNIRKYKYFKCPECQSLLRLPRKVGEVTVTCGKCHHSFKHKA